MNDRRSFQPSDSFTLAASLGLIKGAETVADYAKEADIPAGTQIVVGTGAGPGSLPLPSDDGELVEVYNTDANNAGAVLWVDVLDENFRPVRCVVELTAAVPEQVQLVDSEGNPVQVTRVNAARNFGPRGSGELVTDVVVRKVADQGTLGTVTAESQEMQQAVLTVPAGVTATITSLFLTMARPSGNEASVYFKLYGAQAGQVFRNVFEIGLQRAGTSAATLSNKAEDTFVGPVDLYLTAEATAVTDIGARITLTLIE